MQPAPTSKPARRIIRAGNTHDGEVAVPPLARGVYTVTWEIVADDGHVSNGRFAFGVGVAAPVLAPVTEGTVGPAVTAIVAVLRFALLAALLAALGIAAGAMLAVRAPAVAPVSMLEFGAWLTVAFVAFVDVRVQGAITGAMLIATLHTRYGILHLTLTIAALLGRDSGERWAPPLGTAHYGCYRCGGE